MLCQYKKRHLPFATLLTAALIGGAISANADPDTYTWTNEMGSCSWSDGNSWDIFGIPGTKVDDIVIIPAIDGAGSDSVVTLSGANVDISSGSLTLGGTLTIDTANFAVAPINITSGVLNVGTGGVITGTTLANANGTLNVGTGGDVTSTDLTFANGAVKVTGGSFTFNKFTGGSSGDFIVKEGGSVLAKTTFNLQSGNLTVDGPGSTLATTGTATDTFFVNAGSITVTNGGAITSGRTMKIGIAGPTTVALSGTGSKIVSGDRIYFGADSGSVSATLGGDAYIQSWGSFYMGYKNTATITLNDSARLIKANTGGSDGLVIGDQVGGVGTVTANNTADITSGLVFIIGQNKGKGTVTMNGSSTLNVQNDSLTVGRHAESYGLLVLNDNAKVTVSKKDMEIGRDGARGAKVGDAVPGDAFGGLVQMNSYSKVVVAGQLLFGSGGGKGRLEMRGHSEFTAGTVLLGQGGTDTRGEIEMWDDAKFMGGALTLGHSNGNNATGVISLHDRASVTVASTIVGNNSPSRSGYIYMDGESRYNVTGNITVGNAGDSTGGRGYVDMKDDAVMAVGGRLQIGANSQAGEFVMSGGASVTAAALVVGENWTNTEKFLRLSGDATIHVAGTSSIGQNNAIGRLYLSGNSIFTGGGDAVFGTNTRGPERYVLTMTNDAQFNLTGTANFVVGRKSLLEGNLDAGHTLSNNASVGTENGDIVIGETSIGNMTLNDTASLTAGGSGSIYVAGNGTVWTGNPVGSLTLNGGTIRAGGKIYLAVGNGVAPGTDVEGVITGTANATVTLGGGDVYTQGFVKGIGGTASLTLDGAALHATASSANFFANFAAGDITVGAGGFSFDTGVFDTAIDFGLTGDFTFTKTGTGELTLGGDNSGFLGQITIAEGSGVVQGDVVFSIILDGAKGEAGGILAVGAENPLNVSGGTALTFEDGATLNILLQNAGSLADGTYIYNIFTGNVIYDEAKITVNSASTDVTYTMLSGGQLQVVVSTVPEPGTYAFWAGAVLLGGAVFRRRRAR